MIIGTPKEIKNHENRVGLTPESARELSARIPAGDQGVRASSLPAPGERVAERHAGGVGLVVGQRAGGRCR